MTPAQYEYSRLADPIGPGSKAWHYFDKAMQAYARVPDGNRSQMSIYKRDYKAYANNRDQMVKHLNKAGASPEVVRAWTDFLIAECKARVMNENGEYIA